MPCTLSDSRRGLHRSTHMWDARRRPRPHTRPRPVSVACVVATILEELTYDHQGTHVVLWRGSIPTRGCGLKRPDIIDVIALPAQFVAILIMSFFTHVSHGRRFTRHISVDDERRSRTWNNHRVHTETEISRWRGLGAWCRAYDEGIIHDGMAVASSGVGGRGRV